MPHWGGQMLTGFKAAIILVSVSLLNPPAGTGAVGTSPMRATWVGRGSADSWMYGYIEINGTFPSGQTGGATAPFRALSRIFGFCFSVPAPDAILRAAESMLTKKLDGALPRGYVITSRRVARFIREREARAEYRRGRTNQARVIDLPYEPVEDRSTCHS